MPQASRTWAFATSDEGLVDWANSPIAVSFDVGGGMPAGSLNFAAAANATVNDFEWAQDSQNTSWSSLFGIPGGATVQSIRVDTWDRTCWSKTGPTSGTWTVSMVDNVGAQVHAGGSLASANETFLVTGATFTHVVTGIEHAVNPASQDSNSIANLRIRFDLTSGGAGATNSMDLGIDNLMLTATYIGVAQAYQQFGVHYSG